MHDMIGPIVRIVALYWLVIREKNDVLRQMAGWSLRGHALYRSPGINHKSRVLYPSPVFRSSAAWPSLLKKHYNGLINQPCIMTLYVDCDIMH